MNPASALYFKMAPVTINGNTIDIDPLRASPGYFAKDAKDTNFILVKCKHRLTADEYKEFERLQVKPQQLVEETTYLCKYAPVDLDAIRKLGFVDHAVVYHHDFVISPSLKALGSVNGSSGGNHAPGKQYLQYLNRVNQTTSRFGHGWFPEKPQPHL
jgi:hypothetical protein